MIKRLIYKYVLNDLMKTSDLFNGIYDSKNGRKDLMNGINLVMETIAFKAGIEEGKKFMDMFFENMSKCEGK